MSLRARIALIAAVAVAAAVLVTSIGIYAATARTLTEQTDRDLRQIAEEVVRSSRRPGTFGSGPRTNPLGGPGGFIQVLNRNGAPVNSVGTTLPVSATASDIAAAGASLDDRRSTFETLEVDDGRPVRILTIGFRQGALQVALPVTGNVEALQRLRRQLLFGGLLGMAMAAGLGLVVARRAVRPVEELTDLAEEVATTGDLTRRIEASGGDEVGRLAHTFNQMLGALEEARRSQQQLVADASHELRTPLTSLRTNIEVLEHADRLDEDARRDLLRDVVEQLEEFGRLVDGLVELARGAVPARAATPVRLDEVVEAAVDRARTFATDRAFSLDLAPTTVVAESDRLQRAVANLLDNAVKYGRGAIEVTVADGTVTVRDHGPGIAAEDLPHVFDRFWRSPEARSAPGSGLGLSIVQQVASSHDGQASIDNAPDGGAVVSLRLPTTSA